MTLLLIITDYGSFNNFLAELAAAITLNKNYKLYIICSKSKVINITDKVLFDKDKIKFEFIDIPRSTTLIGQLSASTKIRAAINRIKPDLIHVHFTTAAFPTVLFKKKIYPYWSTFHGLGMNSSSGMKKLIFIIIESFCFIRLDRIFVVNNDDYKLVCKYNSNKVKKYNCLGFGCDIEKFNALNFTDIQKANLKKSLNIGEDVVVIAFTGRYVHFKGFNLVIKSFNILIKKFPGKFKLILMGGTDPIHKTGLDKEEEMFFKTSTDIANVGFTSEVDKYLSITDIFLFPSKKEGLPTCILESLAMGVPIVTFDARGNNDIIKNNYNGILIQPTTNLQTDVENITRSVKELADNDPLKNELAKNALNDRKNYSRSKFINEHLEYYEQFQKNKFK